LAIKKLNWKPDIKLDIGLDKTIEYYSKLMIETKEYKVN